MQVLHAARAAAEAAKIRAGAAAPAHPRHNVHGTNMPANLNPASIDGSSMSVGGFVEGGPSPRPEGGVDLEGLDSRGGVSSVGVGTSTSVESFGRSAAVFMPPLPLQRGDAAGGAVVGAGAGRVTPPDWQEGALQEASRASSFSGTESAQLAAEQAVAAVPTRAAPLPAQPQRRPGSLHVAAQPAPAAATTAMPAVPEHAQQAPASFCLVPSGGSQLLSADRGYDTAYSDVPASTESGHRDPHMHDSSTRSMSPQSPAN